jgi:cytochrome c oxidase subunit 3
MQQITKNFFNPRSKTDDARRAQGAWLLLISLGIFFVSTIMLYALYVVMRLKSGTEQVAPFYLPLNFVLTTIILIAISACSHLSVEAVKREAQPEFLRYLTVTLILSMAFFLVQSFGMVWIVNRFADDGSPNRSLYGMTFVLALLHALHVVGGMIGMGIVYVRALKGRYDHESYFAVRFNALYWHFLDLVWILMLIAFGIAAALSKTPPAA